MAINRRFWRSKKFMALAALVVLLVGIRAVLPIAIERYANRTLDELEGYSGHIDDVDLQLFRGAYQIEGVRIVKTGGQQPVPFFSASEIDLSVQWGALLDGEVVAEIDLHNPKLNFVMASEKPKAQQKQQEQLEPADNWTDVVQELTPFSINRFSVNNGEVHYRDFSSKPQVDIYVQDLQAEARNLTNTKEKKGTLAASFDGRGTAMGSGQLRFKGRVDPYAKSPTFEADVSLNKLQLRQLNPYLRAFANVDVEKGTFAVDAEFAAKNGRFEGYVKPFILDLDVLRWQTEKDSFANKLWQGLVEVVGEVFEDQSSGRAAARIPIEGSFEEPEVGVWSAVGSLFRNAFIEALRRGLEGSVDIEKVAGRDSDDEKSAKKAQKE